MTYKDELTTAMEELAADPAVRFVGYGLKTGRAMGTLKNVSDDQIVETILAEGLMMSAAIGMSLAGLKPVVYFERMDFILNAGDAIVNHLSAMPTISRGEMVPTVIIRCTVGNRAKPLYTGPTHTQNLSAGVRAMVRFPVKELFTTEAVLPAYRDAYADFGVQSTMLVEFKDLC